MASKPQQSSICFRAEPVSLATGMLKESNSLELSAFPIPKEVWQQRRHFGLIHSLGTSGLSLSKHQRFQRLFEMHFLSFHYSKHTVSLQMVLKNVFDSILKATVNKSICDTNKVRFVCWTAVVILFFSEGREKAATRRMECARPIGWKWHHRPWNSPGVPKQMADTLV